MGLLYPGLLPFKAKKVNKIPLSDQGFNYYPVGLSKKQLCYLYWKVRSFKLEISVTNSDLGQIDEVVYSTPDIDILPKTFIPKKSRELIYDWTNDSYLAYKFPERSSHLIYFFASGLNIAGVTENLLYYNDLYWPAFYISVHGAGGSSYGSDGTLAVGSCDFLGAKIPLYIPMTDGVPNYSVSIDSVTLSAAEEWDYDFF
jgi:hypothetical protein